MNNEFEKILERAEDVGVLARRVYARPDGRNNRGFLYKDPDFTIPVKEDELYTLFEKGGEVVWFDDDPLFEKIMVYVESDPRFYGVAHLVSDGRRCPLFSPESEDALPEDK